MPKKKTEQVTWKHEIIAAILLLGFIAFLTFLFPRESHQQDDTAHDAIPDIEASARENQAASNRSSTTEPSEFEGASGTIE